MEKRHWWLLVASVFAICVSDIADGRHASKKNIGEVLQNLRLRRQRDPLFPSELAGKCITSPTSGREICYPDLSILDYSCVQRTGGVRRTIAPPVIRHGQYKALITKFRPGESHRDNRTGNLKPFLVVQYACNPSYEFLDEAEFLFCRDSSWIQTMPVCVSSHLVDRMREKGNPCQVENGGCSHYCHHLGGAVIRCECPTGMSLDFEDQRTCKEHDQCVDGNAGCSHYCIPSRQAGLPPECACPENYVLGLDRKTCLEPRASTTECPPDIPHGHNGCVIQCVDNRNCTAPQVCCSNGCGFVCVEPNLGLSLRAPDVSITPAGTIEITPGGSVNLTCTGSGTPAPTLTWYQNGRRMNQQEGGLSKSEDALISSKTIFVGTLFSTSVFRCEASNIYDSKPAETTVIVLGPGSRPQHIRYKVRGRNVTLIWQPPVFPNGRIVGYNIYYTEEEANAPLSAWQLVTVGNVQRKLLTGLKPTTYYLFRIQAVNERASGIASATFRIRIEDEDVSPDIQIDGVPKPYGVIEIRPLDSLNLTCRVVAGYPSTSLRWHSEGGGQIGETGNNRSSYSLILSSLIKTSRFDCIGSNRLNSSNASVLIFVKGPGAAPQQIQHNVDGHNVYLSWGAPSTPNGVITGYTLYYIANDPNRPLDEWETVILENTQSYVLENLEDDTRYFYTLRAVNEHGSSPLSPVYNFTITRQMVPVVTLDPPTAFVKANPGDRLNVTCRAVGSPQPSVKWTDLTHHQSVVDQVITNTRPEETLKTLVIDRVEESTTFECEATNKHGTAKKMVEVYISGPASPPENIRLSPHLQTITVRWEAPVAPNGEIKGYYIYYTTKDNEHSPRDIWERISVPATPAPEDESVEAYYTLTNLAPMKTYAVQLSAYTVNKEKQIEEGVVSDKYYASTTLDGIAPSIVLNPPRRVVRILPGGNVSVTCSATGRPEPKVTWYQGGREIFTFVTTNSLSSATLTRARMDESTVFQCVAKNSMANDSVEITVQVLGPGEAPRNIIWSVYSNTIDVKWNQPTKTNGMLVGYDIIFTDNPGLDPSQWSAVRATAMANSHKLVNLRPNTSYTFMIRAINEFGPGPWSPGYSVTTEHLEQKPVLTMTPDFGQVHRVKAGSDLNIACAAEGFPKPTVSYGIDALWVDRHGVPEQDRVDVNVPSISKRTNVTCVASNSVGEDTRTVTLEVYGLGDAPTNVKAVAEGTTVRVTWKPPANVESTPERYLLYYSTNVNDPVDSWDKVSVHANYSSFVIPGKLEPNSQYAIRLRLKTVDGYGPLSRLVFVSTEEEWFLNVSLHPELSAEVPVAGHIELFCEAAGEPPAVISWANTSHPIGETRPSQSKLIFGPVYDVTTISCKASNRLKTEEKFVQLVPSTRWKDISIPEMSIDNNNVVVFDWTDLMKDYGNQNAMFTIYYTTDPTNLDNRAQLRTRDPQMLRLPNTGFNTTYYITIRVEWPDRKYSVITSPTPITTPRYPSDLKIVIEGGEAKLIWKEAFIPGSKIVRYTVKYKEMDDDREPDLASGGWTTEVVDAQQTPCQITMTDIKSDKDYYVIFLIATNNSVHQSRVTSVRAPTFDICITAGCEHECHALPPEDIDDEIDKEHPYLCTCRDGYRLNEDGRTCSSTTSPLPPAPTPESTIPDKCIQNSDPGTCADTVAAWYYDNDSGKCVRFVYSGCGGNENRFHSERECLLQCSPKPCPSEARQMSQADGANGAGRQLTCDDKGDYEILQIDTIRKEYFCVHPSTGRETEGARFSTNITGVPYCKTCEWKRQQYGSQPPPGTFLPSCTVDGLYDARQCHASTGYCWCADQITGAEVPGTRRRPGTSFSCSSSSPGTKPSDWRVYSTTDKNFFRATWTPVGNKTAKAYIIFITIQAKDQSSQLHIIIMRDLHNPNATLVLPSSASNVTTTWKLQPVFEDGTGEVSDEFVVIPNAPPQPMKFRVHKVSKDSVTFKWSRDPLTEPRSLTYIFYVRDVESGTERQYNSNGIWNEFTILVSPSKQYAAYMRAIGVNGVQGPPSHTITFNSLAEGVVEPTVVTDTGTEDGRPPDMVTNFQAFTVQADYAVLKWDRQVDTAQLAVSTNLAYDIHVTETNVLTGGRKETVFTLHVVDEHTWDRYVLPTTPGNEYAVYIIAKNRFGESMPSPTVQFIPPLVRPPARPVTFDLRYTYSTPGTVILAWQQDDYWQPMDSSVQLYIIDNTQHSIENVSISSHEIGYSYEIPVVPGHSYSVYMRTSSSRGLSPFSNVTFAVPDEDEEIEPTTTVKIRGGALNVAVLSADSITLTWDASDTKTTGARVMIYIKDKTSERTEEVSIEDLAKGYKIKVGPNRSYSIYAKVVTADGEGPTSNVVTFNTPDKPLISTPSSSEFNIHVSKISGDAVTISWDQIVPGRIPDASATFYITDQTTGEQTEFRVDNLQNEFNLPLPPGKSYSIYMKFTVDGKESGPSNTILVTTSTFRGTVKPVTPDSAGADFDLRVDPPTAEGLKIVWNHNPDWQPPSAKYIIRIVNKVTGSVKEVVVEGLVNEFLLSNLAPGRYSVQMTIHSEKGVKNSGSIDLDLEMDLETTTILQTPKTTAPDAVAADFDLRMDTPTAEGLKIVWDHNPDWQPPTAKYVIRILNKATGSVKEVVVEGLVNEYLLADLAPGQYSVQMTIRSEKGIKKSGSIDLDLEMDLETTTVSQTPITTSAGSAAADFDLRVDTPTAEGLKIVWDHNPDWQPPTAKYVIRILNKATGSVKEVVVEGLVNEYLLADLAPGQYSVQMIIRSENGVKKSGIIDLDLEIDVETTTLSQTPKTTSLDSTGADFYLRMDTPTAEGLKIVWVHNAEWQPPTAKYIIRIVNKVTGSVKEVVVEGLVNEYLLSGLTPGQYSVQMTIRSEKGVKKSGSIDLDLEIDLETTTLLQTPITASPDSVSAAADFDLRVDTPTAEGLKIVWDHNPEWQPPTAKYIIRIVNRVTGTVNELVVEGLVNEYLLADLVPGQYSIQMTIRSEKGVKKSGSIDLDLEIDVETTTVSQTPKTASPDSASADFDLRMDTPTAEGLKIVWDHNPDWQPPTAKYVIRILNKATGSVKEVVVEGLVNEYLLSDLTPGQYSIQMTIRSEKGVKKSDSIDLDLEIDMETTTVAQTPEPAKPTEDAGETISPAATPKGTDAMTEKSIFEATTLEPGVPVEGSPTPSVTTTSVSEMGPIATPSISDRCSLISGPVDLMIILDASDTAYPSEYPLIKTRIRHILDQHATVDNSNVRVAVIQYGKEAVADISLGTYENKASLLEDIANLQQQTGVANTTKALQVALDMFTVMRRDGAQKFILLLTDGTWADTNIKEAANALHVASVQIVAIGIGPLVDKKSLQAVVGESYPDRIFTYPTWTSAALFLSTEVVHKICEVVSVSLISSQTASTSTPTLDKTTAKIGTDAPPSVAPIITKINEISPTSIRVQWTIPDVVVIPSDWDFVIYATDNPTLPHDAWSVHFPPAEQVAEDYSFEIRGLTRFGNYTVCVRAKNTNGFGPMSECKTVHLRAIPLSVNLRTSNVTAKTVELHWDDDAYWQSDDCAYEFFLSETSSKVTRVSTTTKTVERRLVLDVNSGVEYEVKFRVICTGKGTSPYSNTVTFKTPSDSTEPEPSKVPTSVSLEQVVWGEFITWTVDDKTVDTADWEFVIYIAEGMITESTPPTSAKEYTITVGAAREFQLPFEDFSGELYTFWIQARNKYGSGPVSIAMIASRPTTAGLTSEQKPPPTETTETSIVKPTPRQTDLVPSVTPVITRITEITPSVIKVEWNVPGLDEKPDEDLDFVVYITDNPSLPRTAWRYLYPKWEQSAEGVEIPYLIPLKSYTICMRARNKHGLGPMSACNNITLEKMPTRAKPVEDSTVAITTKIAEKPPTKEPAIVTPEIKETQEPIPVATDEIVLPGVATAAYTVQTSTPVTEVVEPSVFTVIVKTPESATAHPHIVPSRDFIINATKITARTATIQWTRYPEVHPAGTQFTFVLTEKKSGIVRRIATPTLRDTFVLAVTPNTTYYLYVISNHDTIGEKKSNTIEFTTPASTKRVRVGPTPGTPVEGAPQVQPAEPEISQEPNGAIRIRWSVVGMDTFSSDLDVVVYYTTDAALPFDQWTTRKVAIAEAQQGIDISGLEPDQLYEFCVALQNKIGTGPISQCTSYYLNTIEAVTASPDSVFGVSSPSVFGWTYSMQTTKTITESPDIIPTIETPTFTIETSKITARTVTITWTRDTETQPTGAEFIFVLTDQKTGAIRKIYTSTPRNHFTIGVNPNTAYLLYIISIHAITAPIKSNTINFTTPAFEKPVRPVPTAEDIADGAPLIRPDLTEIKQWANGSVTIQWRVNGTHTVSDDWTLIVYRTTDPSLPTDQWTIDEFSVSDVKKGIDIRGLTPDQTHNVCVRFRNAMGDGPMAECTNIYVDDYNVTIAGGDSVTSTAATSPPDIGPSVITIAVRTPEAHTAHPHVVPWQGPPNIAPEMFVTSVSDTAIKVSWKIEEIENLPQDWEVVIYYTTDKSLPTVVWQKVVATIKDTEKGQIIADLQFNTKYHICLRLRNNDGKGPFSNCMDIMISKMTAAPSVLPESDGSSATVAMETPSVRLVTEISPTDMVQTAATESKATPETDKTTIPALRSTRRAGIDLPGEEEESTTTAGTASDIWTTSMPVSEKLVAPEGTQEPSVVTEIPISPGENIGTTLATAVSTVETDQSTLFVGKPTAAVDKPTVEPIEEPTSIFSATASEAESTVLPEQSSTPDTVVAPTEPGETGGPVIESDATIIGPIAIYSTTPVPSATTTAYAAFTQNIPESVLSTLQPPKCNCTCAVVVEDHRPRCYWDNDTKPSISVHRTKDGQLIVKLGDREVKIRDKDCEDKKKSESSESVEETEDPNSYVLTTPVPTGAEADCPCLTPLRGDMCLPGYYLWKGRCRDIDECKYNNGNCSDGCVNTIGSFYCACPYGLVRDPNNPFKCVSEEAMLKRLAQNMYVHFWQNLRRKPKPVADVEATSQQDNPSRAVIGNGTHEFEWQWSNFLRKAHA